jgi:hypothetical protein
MSGIPGGGGTVAVSRIYLELSGYGALTIWMQLGVLVGLLSTCIQSVGLTLQRKSHLLEEEKEEEYGYVRRPPYKRRRWQVCWNIQFWKLQS